jgi:hypothetical protein
MLDIGGSKEGASQASFKTNKSWIKRDVYQIIMLSILFENIFYREYSKAISKISIKRCKSKFVNKFSGYCLHPEGLLPPPLKKIQAASSMLDIYMINIHTKLYISSLSNSLLIAVIKKCIP